MMIALTDNIVIGFASENGQLIETINNSEIKKEIIQLYT